MDRQDIFNLIANLFGTEVEEVELESNFYDDFNCEYNDMLELRLQLEDLLKNKIDPEEFAEIETVGELLTFLEDNNAFDDI